MKKKIIFVLCTIVILCIGSIVNAATTLKDIKNTKYEDSVNTLVTLGLVNGYEEEDGTFTYRPDKVVTRAEMAKLMVVALGEEKNVAAASKESAKFKDVAPSDWEFGYVNLASKLGIINGYPDGTFGPKNTVSYAEATAMIIRALEYEDVVSQSSEVWPNNYMKQADELSLYSSVGTVKASDGAKRGQVAILLWNMLRTGVCTPVGQNSTGIVYGEGEAMLNKKMANFVYLENATVCEVDFDDEFEEADVLIKGEKTIEVGMDAFEAAEMYGQKFNLLYNKKTKEFEQLEETDDNDVKNGEVTNVTSKKIYIDGGSSKGYDLPDDDNIILYGIEDLRDAVSANLIFDGSTLKYVVGFAPDKFYLALVIDNDVTVSGVEGIKVINYKASSSKSYKVADDDNLPADGEIILYYLNNDNELVVIEAVDVFDSKEINAISSSSIKIGTSTYKFSDKEFQLVKVGSSELTSMTNSSIDEGEDSAYLIDYAGQRYFVIYIGGLDKANEELEEDIDEALDKLSDYLASTTITNLLKAETTYTQSTYAKFMNAYDSAQTALSNLKATHNISNLNKVNTAYDDLKSAASSSSLKKITTLSASNISAETDIVKAKSELRKIVNGTTAVSSKKVPDCEKNSSVYTTTSYTKFSNALKNARDVLKSTNATYANVTSARDSLKSAMNGLVKKTDADAKTLALNELKVTITKANAIVSKKDEYTEATYNNFKARLDEAKAIQSSSTATADEITAANLDLINAMEILSANLDVIMERLNKYLLVAQVALENEDIYMPESFKTLNDAYNAAEAAKTNTNSTYAQLVAVTDALEEACKEENLITIADKLTAVKEKAANYKLGTIQDLLINLKEATVQNKLDKIDALEEAIANEDKAISAVLKSLNARIAEAKEITADEWDAMGYLNSYDEMQDVLEDAEATAIKEGVTSTELREALQELNAAFELGEKEEVIFGIVESYEVNPIGIQYITIDDVEYEIGKISDTNYTLSKIEIEDYVGRVIKGIVKDYEIEIVKSYGIDDANNSTKITSIESNDNIYIITTSAEEIEIDLSTLLDEIDRKTGEYEIIYVSISENSSDYEFNDIDIADFGTNKEFIEEFFKSLNIGDRFVIGNNGNKISDVKNANTVIIYSGLEI